MPRVFISWSGAASHKVAVTLHTWLPVVLQSVKPFISSEDLKKGGRWVADLSDELEKDSFGILCLTASNLTAPWVLFEAGALSKSVGDSHIAPFLVGVKPSELPQPLTQFNAVLSNKADFKKLVRDINASSSSETVEQDRIDKAVDACWNNIEKELTEAAEPTVEQQKPTDAPPAEMLERFDDILQELLTLNRSQSSLLGSPDKLLPRDYINFAIRASNERSGIPSERHAVWRDIIESVGEVKLALRDPAGVDLPRAVDRMLIPLDFILRRLERANPYT
ncbi:TIR domain-containing protein, partial [Aureimonas sp. D3]|uniref:TIR domain-containing protein n=1 Tax=Aureimonas sp. D3 TaxID=1638164 RepID=UPI0012E369BB